MPAVDHVLYLLESPVKSSSDWSVRVAVDELSPEHVVSRGALITERAKQPLRARKMLMGYLDGYVSGAALERYLESEGLLDILVMPEEAASSDPTEAVEDKGVVVTTANRVAAEVFFNLDETMKFVNWLVRQVAFVLIAYFVVGYGLGWSVQELFAFLFS